MTTQKIFIVGGGGMVGASAAYAMAVQEIAEEIVLIDINEQLVWGQAADISDATAFSDSITVRVGDYSEINDDDIVVITSGAPQQPGQTRIELLGVNAGIMRDVVGKIMASGKQPFIVVVANPVDALTYIALKTSGMLKHRVFGTGTTLDTARLKVKLAQAVNVSSEDVTAYVLGEHGDSSFSAVDGARAGDIPLKNYPTFEPAMIDDIDNQIRERAYKIIEAKKSTYFAIGQVISQIVSALKRETPSIFPVCSLVEGEYGLSDVVLGLPSIVSQNGVKILEGYELNEVEKKQLAHSAQVVRDALDSTS